MKPRIGEIIIGNRIGRRLRDKYMWCACKFCGKERWVRIVHYEPRSAACATCANKPQNAPNYKGVKMTHNGYQKIKVYPDDPYYSMVARDGFVPVHRYVMACHLGRPLERWEIVHHLNGVKTDNRIGNLQLVSDDKHKAITNMENRIKELEKRITILEIENANLKTRKLEQIIWDDPIREATLERADLVARTLGGGGNR